MQTFLSPLFPRLGFTCPSNFLHNKNKNLQIQTKTKPIDYTHRNQTQTKKTTMNTLHKTKTHKKPCKINAYTRTFKNNIKRHTHTHTTHTHKHRYTPSKARIHSLHTCFHTVSKQNKRTFLKTRGNNIHKQTLKLPAPTRKKSQNKKNTKPKNKHVHNIMQNKTYPHHITHSYYILFYLQLYCIISYSIIYLMHLHHHHNRLFLADYRLHARLAKTLLYDVHLPMHLQMRYLRLPFLLLMYPLIFDPNFHCYY